MSQSSNGRHGAVIGPGGRPLTLEDLPPPETKRWVSRRKAEVVTAVRAGLLTLEDACRRYNLSVEEFLSWQRLIESHGVAGLRATRLQDYRREPESDDPGYDAAASSADGNATEDVSGDAIPSDGSRRPARNTAGGLGGGTLSAGAPATGAMSAGWSGAAWGDD